MTSRLEMLFIVVGGILGIISSIRLIYSMQCRRLEDADIRKCMAFDLLVSVVQTVVMSIEQEEKSHIDDGDSAAKEALRHMALLRIKSRMTAEDLQIISDNIHDLDAYILDLVSQQVMLIDRDLITTTTQL